MAPIVTPCLTRPLLQVYPAGLPYEVVPGVTAASAVAGHAGIPITHRNAAPAVALITGHRRAHVGAPWMLTPRGFFDRIDQECPA